MHEDVYCCNIYFLSLTHSEVTSALLQLRLHVPADRIVPLAFEATTVVRLSV